jgi:AraC family transcriptional regulator of adaptative response/methylated-DNA-[protein]-cysteine methyltransferase
LDDDDEFEQLVAKVIGFIDAPTLEFDVPLDVRGTAFQRRVWHALCDVPVGSTFSYTDIAERIGAAKSVWTVVAACAANILAVVIPCHRVVRKDGNLSGYRWDVDRKAELLHRESTTVAQALLTQDYKDKAYS